MPAKFDDMTIVAYKTDDGTDGLAVENGQLQAKVDGKVVASAALTQDFDDVQLLIDTNAAARMLPDTRFCHTQARELQVAIHMLSDIHPSNDEVFGYALLTEGDTVQRIDWDARLEADVRFMTRGDEARKRADDRGWVINLSDDLGDAYLQWRLLDIIELVLCDLDGGRERLLPAVFQIDNVFSSSDLPETCQLPLTVAHFN